MQKIITRNAGGDLTVAIVALALLSAVVVAGVSSYSEFDIVRKDLESATKNTESMILNRVKNDLTETIIEQNPGATQAILNGIKADALDFARDSLSPASTNYLASRNPGDLAQLFSTSVLQLSGSRVLIQVAAEANVSIGIPTKYKTQTKEISGTLKELIAAANNGGIEFNCGDCGTCGACNPATKQCIGVKKIVDNIVQFPDDPVNGRFACKAAIDTLNGQQCLEYGGTIEADGSCDLGNGCKFKEGVYSWNDNNLNNTADVYYNSNKIGDAIDITLTEIDADAGSGTKTYSKDEQFNFANNFTDSDSPIYAVCEGQADDKTRIFVTQQTFQGNLYQEANNLGLGPFITGSGPPHIPANAICNFAASQGGLSGSWQALLRYYAGSPHMATIIPYGNDVYLMDDTPVSQNRQFWGATHIDGIDMDQYGNSVPPGQTWWVWSGFTYNARFETVGNKFISPPNQWMNVTSANCNNWSSNTGDPAGTGYAGGIGTSVHPTDPAYNNVLTLLWAQGIGLTPCNQSMHLYCAQYNGPPLPGL